MLPRARLRRGVAHASLVVHQGAVCFFVASRVHGARAGPHVQHLAPVAAQVLFLCVCVCVRVHPKAVKYGDKCHLWNEGVWWQARGVGELCLTAAQHMVLWSSVGHLSGPANWLADALSRPDIEDRYGQACNLLKKCGAVETLVGTRELQAYWRSRRPPPRDVLPNM